MIDKFDKFNEALRDTNWYLFSNEMQRMVLLFMTFVQQPTSIHGYGDAVCRLESFKKVAFFFELHAPNKPKSFALN